MNVVFHVYLSSTQVCVLLKADEILQSPEAPARVTFYHICREALQQK